MRGKQTTSHLSDEAEEGQHGLAVVVESVGPRHPHARQGGVRGRLPGRREVADAVHLRRDA